MPVCFGGRHIRALVVLNSPHTEYTIYKHLETQTAHGYLLLYGTRALRSSVLHVDGASARSLPADFMGVGIHLQICIPIENTTHVCPEMVADSRTILIGTSDGVVHAYTWHGKVCWMHVGRTRDCVCNPTMHIVLTRYTHSCVAPSHPCPPASLQPTMVSCHPLHQHQSLLQPAIQWGPAHPPRAPCMWGLLFLPFPPAPPAAALLCGSTHNTEGMSCRVCFPLRCPTAKHSRWPTHSRAPMQGRMGCVWCLWITQPVQSSWQ